MSEKTAKALGEMNLRAYENSDTMEVDRERLQSLLSTFLHYIQWAGGDQLRANEKQFEEMSVLELQNHLQHKEEAEDE